MAQAWQPHDYQKHGVRFMVQQGAAGLFQDPGLGKTSETYAAFKVLKGKGLVKRMLVIAPLRPATSTWPDEREKWIDFYHFNVAVLHGKNKDALLRRQGADIDIINPEGLPWLFTSVKPREWPWQMLVVDESTKFKYTTTQRFRTLKPFLPLFKRRYILTGSPAPNGLLDLFGQIYILDLGNSLGRYITKFRMDYFDSTGYGGYVWTPKEDAEERIYDKLRPLVLRMSAKDYLKLPPIVYNTIRVELPAKAKKVYEEMKELLVAQLEDGEVTAANMAAATQKCRQIANGGVYHLDEWGQRTWTNLHEAKTEAVVDLVEELGGKPAFVAYEFEHDLARLQAAFPDAPHLGGGVTPKRQREVEQAWNAGELPVLLAQPQSVAHGLNLQGVGAAVVWHSNTFNLEEKEQFDRRVWRQGQRERVVVHSIVARGTVDESILKALSKKDRTQQALLEALKEDLLKNKKHRR